MTYRPLKVITDELLAEIIILLRIQNEHLAIVTGEALTEEDIDDDSN